MASEGTGERKFDELAQPAAFGLVIADMAFAKKVAPLLDWWCAERSFVASGAAWLILYIYRRIITQGRSIRVAQWACSSESYLWRHHLRCVSVVN